jgi:hypothetical protein
MAGAAAAWDAELTSGGAGGALGGGGGAEGGNGGGAGGPLLATGAGFGGAGPHPASVQLTDAIEKTATADSQSSARMAESLTEQEAKLPPPTHLLIRGVTDGKDCSSLLIDGSVCRPLA